ncbi:unnamed protein product [Strongylus vulgaris]|uniref:Uncharacterized protein n=1 Tax=Strongylus vulgaris TaxID=40348 RepID=A0A3P7I9Q6_STRVU|nr:unnamed protein product [Strongylus vulgaris]
MYRLHGPNGHTSAITSLQFLDNGIVVTSGDDGAVKLWDVMKGQLSSGGSGGCIWRLKATNNLLACAAGSRNGTEDTKVILLDFDAGMGLSFMVVIDLDFDLLHHFLVWGNDDVIFLG